MQPTGHSEAPWCHLQRPRIGLDSRWLVTCISLYTQAGRFTIPYVLQVFGFQKKLLQLASLTCG